MYFKKKSPPNRGCLMINSFPNFQIFRQFVVRFNLIFFQILKFTFKPLWDRMESVWPTNPSLQLKQVKKKVSFITAGTRLGMKINKGKEIGKRRGVLMWLSICQVSTLQVTHEFFLFFSFFNLQRYLVEIFSSDYIKLQLAIHSKLLLMIAKNKSALILQRIESREPRNYERRKYP